MANMRRYANVSCKTADAFRFVQVGRFDCNTQDEVYTGKICAALCYDLFHSQSKENVKVMVEMNFNGKSFVTAFQLHPDYSDSELVRTYHTKPIPGETQRRRLGFKMTTTKEYRHNNAEKCRAASERWRKNKGLEWFRKKEAKRRLDIKIKISGSISGRIWETLKKGSKANRHWEELVGYTVDQLKAHLEKLFKPGMTWENYGTYWHIDHKTPIAVFNFQKPEDIDFRLCWSLKNLQPLQAKDNIRKGAKLEQPFQPSLAIAVHSE